MATGILVTIASVDRTQSAPLSTAPDGNQSWITMTEQVPGTSTARILLYDPDNSIWVDRLSLITVSDLANPGKNVFNGYVNRREIIVVATYRFWQLDCVDLNAVPDTTNVGVPNGTAWQLDQSGQYIPVDPNAIVIGGSDSENVQRLFAAYWAGPVDVDTTTYVDTISPDLGLVEPVVWNRVSLRNALDDIATLAGPYTRWWIDADAFLHWTSVPQAGAPSGGGGVTGSLPMLFPQSDAPLWPPAPYAVSDSPDGVTSISYENFKYVMDDTGAAASLYANGATDYTMALNPRPTPDGVVAAVDVPPPVRPNNGSDYVVYLTAAVQVYGVDWSDPDNPVRLDTTTPYGSAGTFVNTTYESIPSSDGTVKQYYVIHTDGSLVFPDGYAIWSGLVSIRIYPYTSNPNHKGADLGVGGTGWVQDGDPSWLSRYIDLPSASSQAARDTQGGTALDYASDSLIRGSCDVVYPSVLFRAGMGLEVTSAPAGLDAETFMITKVTTTFLSGTDLRRAALEWGTGPFGTLGMREQAKRKAAKKLGATIHRVWFTNANPSPGSTVTAKTQLCNHAGEPWHIRGKPVDWSVQVFDRHGNDVTAAQKRRTSFAHGWKLSATSSLTDHYGRASTRLTLSTSKGLQYFMTATTPD